MPTIWIDADAIPNVIKEILIKASLRTKIPLKFVANRTIAVPKAVWIQSITVSQGFDIADNYIVSESNPGELVITQDIPLAAELMENKVQVISPRGFEYSKENIKQKLNMRDFMETMRFSGEQTGGPPPIGNKEKQMFANALDKWLQINHT